MSNLPNSKEALLKVIDGTDNLNLIKQCICKLFYLDPEKSEDLAYEIGYSIVETGLKIKLKKDACRG